MAITEQQIRSIVEQVVSKMIPEHKAVTDKSVTEKSIEPLNQTGTYSEMDKLIDAAEEAQRELISMTLEKRKQIIQNIRDIVIQNMDTLCRMAVEETV
jgi:acyl-CoA reductase-like NAD-dependent aldehyde dehydrogenase